MGCTHRRCDDAHPARDLGDVEVEHVTEHDAARWFGDSCRRASIEPVSSGGGDRHLTRTRPGAARPAAPRSRAGTPCDRSRHRIRIDPGRASARANASAIASSATSRRPPVGVERPEAPAPDSRNSASKSCAWMVSSSARGTSAMACISDDRGTERVPRLPRPRGITRLGGPPVPLTGEDRPTPRARGGRRARRPRRRTEAEKKRHPALSFLGELPRLILMAFALALLIKSTLIQPSGCRPGRWSPRSCPATG